MSLFQFVHRLVQLLGIWTIPLAAAVIVLILKPLPVSEWKLFPNSSDDPPISAVPDRPPAFDQESAAGRIAMGRALFLRCLRAADTQDRLAERLFAECEFRRREGQPLHEASRFGPDWPDLWSWWNTTGKRLPHGIAAEFPPADRRFSQLADQTSRTSAEEAELAALIHRCGHDWLQIPYQEGTQQFDFQAPLPDTAPETTIRKMLRLYTLVTGKDYYARP